MRQIVIVGAGQSGATCATKLRALGFEGNIALIGAETHLPYQRPPLSKGYLCGEISRDRLFLHSSEFYRKRRIDVVLSRQVDSINKHERTVTAGAEDYHYDALILATGSSPNQLPTRIRKNFGNVFSVRSLENIDLMAPFFRSGANVVVIGGGYIGLEAASVAAKIGINVTIVEQAQRILARVAAPETSDFVRALHAAHGVNIIEGQAVRKLVGDKGVATGAELSDGTKLDLDFAIVGTGIFPSICLAETAGVAVENGIKVDAYGRTSQPNIWGAGDCTSFPYRGRRIRLESVPHAIKQAEIVAENILGAEKQYRAQPWFWSDQYDVKLQIAGLNHGYHRVVSRRSGEHMRSFWYFIGDELLAVDAINDPRSYMVGKKLIERGQSLAPDLIADPATDLKALI